MCLSISEVSELTGITPSNLRFYEEEGILDIPRNGTGHRVYSRQEMADVLGLMCLKRSGLELQEIKRFFRLVRQGDSTLHERHNMLKESCDALQRKIDKLKKTLKYSNIKRDFIGQCCEAYEQGKPLPQVDPEWMDTFLKKRQ